jgi:hypothetical protein
MLSLGNLNQIKLMRFQSLTSFSDIENDLSHIKGKLLGLYISFY